MRWPLAWLALALLAASVPLPGALAADELPALYFTAEAATGPGGDLPQCSGLAYALAPAVPADGKAYHGASTTTLACGAYFVYPVTGAFALSGNADAHFFTSCDRPVVVGTPATVTYRLQLRRNADTITQVDASGGFAACQGPSTVTEMDVAIDTKDTEFSAGDKLTLAILVWTSGASDDAAGNFHYLVGPTRPSRLMAAGLPSLGGGNGTAPFTAGNLTGPEASSAQSFANTTTATFQYSWATNLTAAEATVDATVGNGSVSLRVVDGAGATVLNRTFNQTANTTLGIPHASAGNWSIVVAYSNFTGQFRFAVGAPAPAASESGSGSESSAPSITEGSGANDDNRTGTFPLRKDDKGTPGLGVPLLLAVTAAAAVLVRRRAA